MIRKLLVILVVLAAVAAWRSTLFVDETEMVIVTEFGQPVRTAREAGLHWKLPWQSAIRIDRRLQIYDPRPSEFLTAEKKNVDLDVFVCWKVDEEDPLRFLEKVSGSADPAAANTLLHDIVWAKLAADVGSSPLEALVSTDAQTHRLDQLVEKVTEACRAEALSAYAIQIVDVRLKRVNLPAQVRESVFGRMRTERARIAGQYRAEGEEQAMMIRSAADKESKTALAQAEADALRTRGTAEAEAMRIYSQAHQKNPQFYELVRSLEAYRKILDEKTTVVLSAQSDLLKYLTRGQTPTKEVKGKQ
jgi:membrane protease subunit HflC